MEFYIESKIVKMKTSAYPIFGLFVCSMLLPSTSLAVRVMNGTKHHKPSPSGQASIVFSFDRTNINRKEIAETEWCTHPSLDGLMYKVNSWSYNLYDLHRFSSNYYTEDRLFAYENDEVADYAFYVELKNTLESTISVTSGLILIESHLHPNFESVATSASNDRCQQILTIDPGKSKGYSIYVQGTSWYTVFEQRASHDGIIADLTLLDGCYEYGNPPVALGINCSVCPLLLRVTDASGHDLADQRLLENNWYSLRRKSPLPCKNDSRVSMSRESVIMNHNPGKVDVLGEWTPEGFVFHCVARKINRLCVINTFFGMHVSGLEYEVLDADYNYHGGSADTKVGLSECGTGSGLRQAGRFREAPHAAIVPILAVSQGYGSGDDQADGFYFPAKCGVLCSDSHPRSVFFAVNDDGYGDNTGGFTILVRSWW